MPTEALLCPACHAADTSRPDAYGIHTCAYCGVRYRIDRGTPTRMASTSSNASPSTTRIAVAGVVAVLVVAIGVLIVGRSTPPPAGAPPLASPPSPAGTPTPAAAPPPTPATLDSADPVASPAIVAVEPPAPLTATFELNHRRPSSGTAFYAIGWATNTSSVAIDRPKVTAVLRDDKGAEVGTAFGFAEGDAIAPGGRAPVEILVDNPPAFTKIEFELEPRAATYIPRHVAGLRLEHTPARADGFGTKIAGKVFNEGSEPARFVHIQALTFDAEGKLIGIDDTYANADVLAAGASTRFELNMLSTGGTPAKYELTVTGSPVD